MSKYTEMKECLENRISRLEKDADYWRTKAHDYIDDTVRAKRKCDSLEAKCKVYEQIVEEIDFKVTHRVEYPEYKESNDATPV